jgi:hypothetical protein
VQMYTTYATLWWKNAPPQHVHFSADFRNLNVGVMRVGVSLDATIELHPHVWVH